MPEQSQDQNPAFVHRAFSAIASRYVLTNHVLSLGIDILWRRRVAVLVREINPRLVLDVATGSGDLAMTVAAAVPDARVIGADFCAPMLAEARKRGLPELMVCDGLALPFPDDTFDAITIGYGLRNMADWAAALREFSRVLKPGGRLVVLDFSLPGNPLLRAPYRFYLHRVLPLLAGTLTGNREAYSYLGDSIERFPSGDRMIDLIGANGFEEVRWEPQLGGVSSVYSGTVPS
ncbi:MAG: class I SAM-dependent methyltransferase [Verrucomicrobiales bacterium]|jgi:demethylmenaquinone methyltransferase / 2-methoxy-6-polyprenyl-1,4-benzoquinol methylase|nr:class I SAM-dependent methyltransferase [Verrucomicrobiales bacterium]MDP4792487.1 class I SAM-dependent methyltransferase [Verrucomicrobiales bacterium]